MPSLRRGLQVSILDLFRDKTKPDEKALIAEIDPI
jgi:hypothetical protein